MKRVLVVGGGVAGLSTAFRLREAAPRVETIVLEASGRAGGKIQTESAGAFLFEHGPNGFLDNEPATLDLVAKAGISGRVVRASPDARRRYVFLRGRLCRLPESPPAFLRADLLSLGGKLRAGCDLFVRRADAARAARESVAQFARRRFGEEALRAMVEPFVTGVFAGDVERLELASAFPRLAELERKHGSLIRALLSSERARRAAARSGAPRPATSLASFRDGMRELPDALARKLGDALVLHAAARSVAPLDGGRWRVAIERSGAAESIDADAVVLALPAPAAATLVERFARDVAAEMRAIEPVPVAVVGLGFGDAAARPAAFDGFGFLVARGERLRILGALAESSIWPGRRGFFCRAMIGGARAPELARLDDDALIRVARDDLRAATGLAAEPSFARVARWPAAIPQYAIGHAERLARLEVSMGRFQTLALAGASYRGVAVNDLCRQAAAIAERIAAGLRDARAGDPPLPDR